MTQQSNVSIFTISRVLALMSVATLAACAKTTNDNGYVATPTVDYVEGLDVYSAPHQDSFLNQLAMNYRSYAIYNARTSGYPDVGELFANKAVTAFSGEVPFPETLDSWTMPDEQTAYQLSLAYNEMIDQFKNDASDLHPELAAELQAKYDCWISATSTGQLDTADECHARFETAMETLRNCDNGVVVATDQITTTKAKKVRTVKNSKYYPETGDMAAMRATNRSRDGVVIVNNINVPENLVKVESVQGASSQPMVFNQNIYGGDTVGCDCPANTVCDCPRETNDYVTRQEFIDMMMAMRAELAAINARLDELQAGRASDEKTVIKVQQIPLEPKQRVMEEIFEIRFDFDKAVIKPEYRDVIDKLVGATRSNKNIRVSVVGHTDTAGSKSYNYALGGRRAEAVQKMLIKEGIPASQIIAVSAGEEDLKVQTGDGVPNAANRRVRVVKETSYTEQPDGVQPVANISVESYSQNCEGDCD